VVVTQLLKPKERVKDVNQNYPKRRLIVAAINVNSKQQEINTVRNIAEMYIETKKKKRTLSIAI
jgi:hypothetical protein